MYYCGNFKTIKKDVNLLNANDTLAIGKIKKIMSKTNSESNFGFLATTITSLETQGTLLTDAIKTVENEENKLNTVKYFKGITIYLFKY